MGGIRYEKTIRVTGKGKLVVKSDTIRLLLTFEGIQEKYDKAVKQSSVMIKKLKPCLKEVRFFGQYSQYNGNQGRSLP